MIAPTEDRIVVLPDAFRDDVTEAGLIVAGKRDNEVSQRQLGHTGIIVAVGPGKRNRTGERMPLSVQTGDRIAYGEFAYKEHFEGATRYLIMQEGDVCGVFEAA